ncbi:uncharacterized protein zgc:112980 [Syngnathus scovelli]|uniref:uncharacterized protein zgc:112980 n=1 Tax=Syngnathus scovelli TaxID=161590 RepID=UPI00210F4F00|nr:uncharacterized protein zgc:112980 [Syngnathus scovelli]
MGTAADNDSVILVSDDDDEDCNQDTSRYDSSLIIMETQDVPRKDSTLSPSKLDEDLVVIFSRPAELLPHARFDCPKHPFTATDKCGEPVPGNQLVCGQCFCYICDKLATECERWHQSGACHCNSHKKSNLWNQLRNHTLLGHLAAFKVTLSEVDAHLRQAESALRSFKAELCAQMTLASSMGDGVSYDCTAALQYVLDFVNKAEQHDARAAALMRLGAADDFLRLFYAKGVFCLASPSSTPASSKWMLMRRLLSALQRQLVMDDFTPEFRQKLQDFYRNLTFPPELTHIRDSLDVRPWDDILLASVLKGQNVIGVRTTRGMKDTLFEDFDVVLLRVQRLVDQNRFRELRRYLQVVRTNLLSGIQWVKDLVPFFMCMEGDFHNALFSIFKAASRLTSHRVLMYLRLLDTATAPKLSISPTGELHFADEWHAIQGAAPLARLALVRFALKVHELCPAVHKNSEFWLHLLKMVQVTRQAPAGLRQPSLAFLEEAVRTARFILEDESGVNLQIPQHFMSTFPDQAMLLLVSAALGRIIACPPLSPIIPLICTFQKNVWALHCFWRDLLPTDRYQAFIVHKIYQELKNPADFSTHDRSRSEVLWPAPIKWNHFLQLKDFLPFLLCLEGQTCQALKMFFPKCGPAAWPTAFTFPLYLRLFGSGTVPRMSLGPTGELCAHGDTWHCVPGASALTRLQLVHFALKVLHGSAACYHSSQCWISLLNMVTLTNSLSSIPEPSSDFKREAVTFAGSVLLSYSEGLATQLKIPQSFLPYSDQALLLLVTRALRQIIFHLMPVLPILSTFEKSLWALRWFWTHLSDDGFNNAIMDKVQKEVWQTTANASLQSIHHLLDPSSTARNL